MFILATGVVCRRENGEWVKRPVGGCGLSGQVWRVGQEACWRSVVCRVKFVAWVKGIVGECGLSGQVWRVGQENCRRGVVCRGEIAAWVKGPVGGVWSVGAKMLRGSKELAAECGLSGRKGRVGQENCWRSVVCRDKFVAWVKGIGDGVWSVGASLLRGSRELSARVVCRVKYGEWVKGIVGECGLSGQVWRVGQRNCRRGVVCRDKFVAWVKGIVGGVWSVGAKTSSGSRELSTACGLSARKGRVGQRNWRRVWSVGVKTASESKKPHISYAPNVANRHSDQNCQNPQNMIHLL